MEKTNNDQKVKNNSMSGLAKFGIAVLAGLSISGVAFYYVYKTNSAKQPESQSSELAQSQSESTPAMEASSSASPSKSVATQSVPDLTGKWAGKYKVTSPKGCAGFSGSWTANLKQSGDSFSGSYKSDVLVNGVVSGKYSGVKGFNWTVSGGGGAQLSGSVTGPNSIGGSFTGPTCPGTSQRTSGTFSGGR